MVDVVVAEDDPDIRDLVSFVVTDLGLTVHALPDGSALVETCLRERPQLVLLDVSMPKLDGLEACRRLRAEPGLAGLRVLLMTAHGRDSDVVAGYAAGADGYLVKPFPLGELTRQVQAAVG